jgi:hypothetical protein
MITLFSVRSVRGTYTRRRVLGGGCTDAAACYPAAHACRAAATVGAAAADTPLLMV